MTKTTSPIKRLHTRDRRRFSAPTTADVKCPYFDDTFFRMGVAYPADDLVAVCNDLQGDTACEYRNTLIDGELCACHRYWKESINSMVEKSNMMPAQTGQTIDVEYHYEQDLSGFVVTLDAEMYFDNIRQESIKITDWSKFPTYGADVWDKSNPTLVRSNSNTDASRLIYEGNGYTAMKDYTFSVKGYVSPNQSDGDWVGVVFRQMDKNNYYLLTWDGGDNGSGLRLLKNTTTDAEVLWDSSLHWQRGQHYAYSVRVTGASISVKVDNITRSVNVAEFTIDDPTPISKGTFGMYASSQQDAYFYDVEGFIGRVITHLQDKDLTEEYKLTYSVTGGFSKPVGEYFEKVVEEWKDNDPNFKLNAVRYVLKVPSSIKETVYFEDTKSFFTYDGSQRVQIPGYLSGKLSFKEEVDKHNPLPIFRTDTFAKDVILTSYSVNVKEPKIQDALALSTGMIEILSAPQIINYEYKDSPGIPVSEGNGISFKYEPDKGPLQFFTGPSIDTHQKVFKLRANVLGWHANPIKGDVE